MILQRFTAAIKAQEWSTVALEVAIVVVGIFLGLQVDDWNQSRVNRALEQQYLERLHADARAAVARQREMRKWNEERVRTQDVVLAALRSGMLPAEHRDDFGRGLALAGSHNPLIWQWGVVEELYATGNIALLRDTALRDLLALTESEYRRSTRIIDVAEAQAGISRGQLTGRFDPIDYGFQPGAGGVQVDYDFQALAADPAFVAAFSNLQVNSRRIATFGAAHLKDLEQLEAAIAHARDVHPMPAEPTD